MQACLKKAGCEWLTRDMHARWLAPWLTLAICGANLHVAPCQLSGKSHGGIFTRFIFLQEVLVESSPAFFLFQSEAEGAIPAFWPYHSSNADKVFVVSNFGCPLAVIYSFGLVH